MVLRQAGLSDLPQIMSITKNVIPLMVAAGNTQWSETYPNAEIFTQDINEGTLLVFEEKEIKGFVVVDDNHAEAYEEISWTVPNSKSKAMHRMAVDPKFQGQRIAASIFKEAETFIRESGFEAIHTDTSLENKEMQSIFSKKGYSFKGKLHLDENIEDWYVAYEKVLN